MKTPSTSSPERIRRTVLREQVKAYILDAILSGSLPAGERLVESQLARQLGVSQAPVREALRELEQMGVVHTEPFRGAWVRSLTKRDLQESYSVRAVLEELAASRAAERVDDKALAELEDLVERMIEAAQAGEPSQLAVHDVAFHRRIVELSDNAFLVRVWGFIHPANWTLVSTKLFKDRLVYLAGRHQEVVEALRSRDPECAGRTMRRHIEELAELVGEMPM